MKTSALIFGLIALIVVLARAVEAPSEVTVFPAERIAAGFAKGGPLIETPEYKVHTARREGPGGAELHGADTDIFHILEGSAVFVTGGTIPDPQTVGPGEIRGKEINGGKAQRVAKGDVIIIPPGIAHWFKEVNPPLLYYVVKITRQSDK